MKQNICEELRQWLTQASPGLRPTPALQAHVADCAACQAALLLLAATALDVPAPTTIDCQDCLADLPMYIEHEQDDPIAAARIYPQLWWHLWTCQDCAETYQCTVALLVAEKRGEISTPLIVKPILLKPEPVSLLHLTRQFLRRALPTPALLAPTMRGHSEGPVVLSSRAVATGQHLTLSVQEQSDGGWSVIVAMLPPQAGWMVLALGDERFRTPFDTQGSAVVSHVPATLLAATAGPDLVVAIEPA